MDTKSTPFIQKQTDSQSSRMRLILKMTTYGQQQWDKNKKIQKLGNQLQTQIVQITEIHMELRGELSPALRHTLSPIFSCCRHIDRESLRSIVQSPYCWPCWACCARLLYQPQPIRFCNEIGGDRVCRKR